MSLQETVAASLNSHGLLDRGRRIAVAVSGGADSVFLLHILQELGLAAAVLHVNHRLRGPDSDADQAFVAALAARLNLPLFTLTAPPAAGNLEQEARRARYDFFARHMAAGLCDAVATGHTLDDQAETVLARFLRGSGTAGLAGIKPVTAQNVVRPLLDLRRAEIRGWLTAHSIPWREDASNENPGFLRNRLRLEILPRLMEINPALPEVLASTASWAAAEEAWWESELDRLAPAVFTFTPETTLCRTTALSARPLALQRRLLRRAILHVRGDLRAIDFRHIEAIRRLTESREGSGRLQIPGLDIYRSFDWLRLAPPGFDSRLERDFEAPLSVSGAARLPERLLTIEMELVSPAAVYNDGMDVVDRERSGDALTLRNWRPGDSYTPLGRTSPVKIKTLFQESRIPLWERRTWPVIVRGGEIVWSRGFGAASEFAAGPGTREGLRICERQSDSEESNMPPSTSTELSGVFDSAVRRVAALRPGKPDADVSSGEAK
ncbi:MAG: tRNA lysidine(34) synthetase TilS [Acidobacteriota bacterium]|nr:tRNA lysidine(34) synthetase TilS [Acidobacteriota bacterium]